MSFIDIENDLLLLSSSPPFFSLNYFPKKFYRLYQSFNSDENIIINGSFLFNGINELYKNDPSLTACAESLLDQKSNRHTTSPESLETRSNRHTTSPESLLEQRSNRHSHSPTKPFYKNIERLYIHTKIINFYINIDKMEIEDNINNFTNIIYQSEIIKKKNIKYREFVLMLSNPILINISYDIKTTSNCVTISCINDDGCGGSSYLYLYDKFNNSNIKTIDNINSIC